MYDKCPDVIEHSRERPSHAHAREQLTKAGIKVKTDHPSVPGGIVRADPDAIIFLNEFGRVMTAWSEVSTPTGSKVTFRCEAGLPAWPSKDPG